MYLLVSKFRFLEYRLLLSRVSPYYSSLPRTVWIGMLKQSIKVNITSGFIFNLTTREIGLYLEFLFGKGGLPKRCFLGISLISEISFNSNKLVLPI